MSVFTITSSIEITGIVVAKPCKIDTSKYLVCSNSSSTMSFRLIEFSGSSITKTDLSGTITADEVYGITALDATHFVILYYSYPRMRTIACSLSGTTLSFGTSKAVLTYNTGNYPGDITTLSSSKFAMIYTGSSNNYVQCGTVSSNEITIGSEVSSTGNGGVCNIFKLDTDKIGYIARNGDGKPVSAAGTISGTTITMGTIVTVLNSNLGLLSGCAIDTDKFMVVIPTSGAYICTVSGTTITVGSVVTVSNLDYQSSCTSLSSAAPIIMGGYSGNNISINKCALSGTTLSIGANWDTVVGTGNGRITAISDSAVAIVGNNNKTYVGYIATTSNTTNFFQFF